MTPAQTSVWIILGYLALLVGLGFVTSRKFKGTASDYFLASRGIGWFLLVMSLFGTTMTAFALIGSTGESFKAGIGVYGMMASWSGIVHSACFFLVGIKLWSLGAKHGYVTQIQFFRDRFESDKLGIILFPVLVGLVIPYLLIGVMGAGVTIEKITGGAFPSLFAGGEGPGAAKAGAIPYWLGSGGICIVVLMYIFLGGVRGAAWANAFQTMVFILLGIITFFVIADKLGGMKQATAMVLEKNPHALRRTVRADDPLTRYEEARKINQAEIMKWHARPKDQRGAPPEGPHKPKGITYLHFLTYMFIPLSVGMFPHLFQHWLTAKSANSFKLPVVAHPLFIMIVWVPCVLIGVWATTDLLPPKPPLPQNPNAILPFLVKTQTPAVLGGFLTAGILAAIMSSLDSQFLCLGTMFTEDIAVHYAGKDRLSDRQVVLLARSFIVAIVALTYLFSLSEPRGVFTLGVWCFSGFSSLFPLVFAALYWPRLTKAGAYASVLAAISSWIYLFHDSGYAEDETYTVTFNIAGGEYHVMPVALMFVASTVALVAVSLATKPPSAATLRRFFPERVA
ncbi:MAG: sodium:solute symporter family protein [Phycisphaerales bacterium]|nr:sodium:solute symporter family protein [Phycisphaerales bacterium]